ncbi:LysR substrate binding domain protein [Desulfitobacterium hafniense]|uniref:LysR substrate binding domain protein n=1 Tax=Desulfitobacterium hafniense TaxID=49338 RepID=A0A098AX03_DESHA|nr:LysR family transcriptional regulator [Desulfitobacterium hafniense]CDX00652.1 LysR substrate binding domain protein [Desulfitobacterium hafniense]
MEMRQLRYFDSVVKYGTMREAAARLFISEPSISQQINELQKEIGVPLFEKQGRKIALTAEGRQLLPLVQAILEAVTELETGISEILNPSSGLIRLGVIPITRLDLVPKKLTEFVKIYPDICVELIESGTSEIIERLLNDTMDVALIAANSRIKSLMEMSGIKHKVVSNANSVAVVSCSHPLAKYDKISFSRLLNERIILRRQGIYREEIDNFLGDSVKNDGIYSTDTYETAIKLVDSNLGIAIVPETFISTYGLNEGSNIKILFLDDFQVSLDICFIYKKRNYYPLFLTNFMRIFTDSNDG